MLPNVLHKQKITLVHNYVTARFPESTISKVNKAIGEKLRDYRKSKGIIDIDFSNTTAILKRKCVIVSTNFFRVNITPVILKEVEEYHHL